jgi:hypothetical protein
VLGHAGVGVAADTIFTPPLVGGSATKDPSSLLACYVVNTASTAQTVSISILSLSGTDISANPVTNGVLPAGAGTGVQSSERNIVGVIVGYCKVTGDGPPRSLLVSLCNSTRVGATDNCVAVVIGQSQGSGGF